MDKSPFGTRNAIARARETPPRTTSSTQRGQAMHGLYMLCLIVIIVMIYVLGHIVWRAIHDRRAEELTAHLDRKHIRQLTEQVCIEVQNYNRLLEQFPSVRERHLRLIREQREES